MNQFMVGARGDKVVIVRVPLLLNGITPDEAVELAAWLVACAMKSEADFAAAFKAVCSS